MTRACLGGVGAKPMVVRTRRVMRGRPGRGLRSLCCVVRWPGVGAAGARGRLEAPQESRDSGGFPHGSRRACSGNTTVAGRRPPTEAPALARGGSARRPAPAWETFLPAPRRPRRPRRCARWRHRPGHLRGGSGREPRGGHRRQGRGGLLACPPPGGGPARQGSRRLTPPLAGRLRALSACLRSGPQPRGP